LASLAACDALRDRCGARGLHEPDTAAALAAAALPAVVAVLRALPACLQTHSEGCAARTFSCVFFGGVAADDR
jgi:hypothetical protein